MKTKIMIATVLVALLPITACGSHKATVKGDSYRVSTYNDKEESVIKRDLKLSNFTAIDNSYAVEVHYTQGTHYNVIFEGSQKAYDIFNFYVENNALKIKLKKEYQHESINIKKGTVLHITAPNLVSLNNSGSFTFKTGSWKITNLNVKNSGALKFSAQVIEGQSINFRNSGAQTVNATIDNVQNVNIDNNGSFRYPEGSVVAGEVSIYNSGASKIDIPFQTKNIFSLRNSGSSKLNGTVNAASYKEKCSGSATNNVTITANELSLDISGAGKINGSFKGKNAEIHGSGMSKIDMTVDCEKLYIESSGSSKITVKGTADDTTFENNGVTNVDATELNKF